MQFLESLRRLESDFENVDDFEQLPVHSVLEKRFKNTLYLGKTAEGISLPVADVAVDLFQNAAEKKLGTFNRRHVAKFNRNGLINPSSSVLGMMYARRLKRQNSDFLKKVTSTELFLVSMMLATKFLYDEGEDEEIFSDEWADSAKMDVKRVNELEREFLDAIDWDLYIKPDEYYEFLQGMETWIALREGERRGWFSYSDFNVLMDQRDWLTSMGVLFDQTTKVLGICMAVYSLCSAAMCWSLLVMQHQPYTLPGAGTMHPSGNNHSHVFHGVLPLKSTQSATHQSEIPLPPAAVVSASDGSVSEDQDPAPCPSCRQVGCRNAPQRKADAPYASDCRNVEGEACCGEENEGDFWLHGQIARARRATATFYQALVLAYYDAAVKGTPTIDDEHPDSPRQRDPTRQTNKSRSQMDHHSGSGPTFLSGLSSNENCPHHASTTKSGISHHVDVVVPDSGILSHQQCSPCEGATRRGSLRETIHMLLPSYAVDSAIGIGLTTGTIPVIGA